PFINALMTQQTVVEKSGGSAESLASGATINTILRSGSNAWRFTMSGKYTTERLQADNLDQALRDRGLETADKPLSIYDFGAAISGPLATDRLWFIMAPRYWGDTIQIAGNFFNKTQASVADIRAGKAPIYTPDFAHPATRYEHILSRPV